MTMPNNTQASTLVLNKEHKIIAARIHSSANELGTILDAYQKLVEQLEQRNKLFKALACSIAHEMRHPFNAIAGCVDVIQDEPELSPHLAEYIGYIDHSIQHGSAMINIILNNVHQQEIDTSEFQSLSIAQVTKQALKIYPFKEGERELVTLDIQQDFNFEGSETLLHYTLFNLLKNSLYYARTAITIKIVATAQEHALYFTDIDVGISQDKLATLFDDFTTSNSATGTGLGLAFCKRAMQAIRGDIACQSIVGEYTSFKLSFQPIKKDI